jgi:hypothetical protein
LAQSYIHGETGDLLEATHVREVTNALLDASNWGRSRYYGSTAKALKSTSCFLEFGGTLLFEYIDSVYTAANLRLVASAGHGAAVVSDGTCCFDNAITVYGHQFR